jgi:glycosyltransferase involved in cell wall biosynthesis
VTRLAIIASHPIQYHAPLFRELARRLDLTVFYAHRATPADQAKAGFGVGFDWDIDLLSGYDHEFLRNVARRPRFDHFGGCDTPEIGAQLREGHFDAVLLPGWHLKSYVQALFAAKRQGLPVLVRGDSHLGTPRSPLKKAIKEGFSPPFLRLFDAALYVGQRSRAYWIHYRYPAERLFFSPHCVDTEWFAARATDAAGAALRGELGIAPDAKLALFVGKLVPFKQPLDLIRAAGMLKSASGDITVIVAGAGPLEREIAAASREACVPLHPLGFRNQSEMPAVYAAADVLVLPSNGRETWGLAANEALACGRPVILSDAVGAAPDLAGDGTAGRIYPVGDVAALAFALREVLTSPIHADRIAAKSRAYGISAAAAGIEAALLNRHGERPGNRFRLHADIGPVS